MQIKHKTPNYHGMNSQLCSAIWLVIQYGDRMRAWLDIGYSTQENN
jgi:hypothetical protein